MFIRGAIFSPTVYQREGRYPFAAVARKVSLQSVLTTWQRSARICVSFAGDACYLCAWRGWQACFTMQQLPFTHDVDVDAAGTFPRRLSITQTRPRVYVAEMNTEEYENTLHQVKEKTGKKMLNYTQQTLEQLQQTELCYSCPRCITTLQNHRHICYIHRSLFTIYNFIVMQRTFICKFNIVIYNFYADYFI